MKRIATLITIVSITAIAGAALAESKSAPVNCTPNANCGCQQAPGADGAKVGSFEDWKKRIDELTTP